jgi:hypothetical protein
MSAKLTNELTCLGAFKLNQYLDCETLIDLIENCLALPNAQR